MALIHGVVTIIISCPFAVTVYDVINLFLIPNFLLFGLQVIVNPLSSLILRAVKEEVTLCLRALKSADGLYIPSILNPLLVNPDERVLVSHELLELFLLGVDVWIIKLEIWVIIELLLDDHLLNLLPIVLFLEGLLYVSISLFFLLLLFILFFFSFFAFC